MTILEEVTKEGVNKRSDVFRITRDDLNCRRKRVNYKC
jgi:hypothetical protein